jgi:hypothetical protein
MSSVLRIAVHLLVLSACSALVAACGGGATRVAKSRDVAFANAVNLRRADVPRMSAFVSGFETNGGPPFGACATSVHATSDEVVAVSSPRFRGSSGLQRAVSTDGPPAVKAVHSIVYVMHNSDTAGRNVAALQDARVASCVKRLSVREAAGRVVRGEPYKRPISASSLPFPLSGIPGYWLRVDGTLAASLFGQKNRPTFYEDTFGFAIGRAEIVLYVVGVVRPVSLAVERRLLSVLYDRARSHILA